MNEMIIRSKQEIDAVEAWAGRQVCQGKTCDKTMTYEEGIFEVLQWLQGKTDYAFNGAGYACTEKDS